MEEMINLYKFAEMYGQALQDTPAGRVLQHVAKRPRIRVKQSTVFWRPARVRLNEIDRGEGVTE